MRSFVTMALVACVLFLLAGCNGGNSSKTEAPPINIIVETPAPEKPAVEKPAVEKPEVKEPEVKEPEAAELLYERGILTDTGYESRYLGLRFTAPAGYIMVTDEELMALMGLGAEYLDIDQKTLDYALLTTVYEMMVTAPSGSPNVNLLVEKLPFRNITVEQYFDAVKPQLVEFGYEVFDLPSVEIAGQTYQQLGSSLDMFGTTLLQRYMTRKIDDRMVSFIASATPDKEEALSALMGAFKKY